MKKYIKAVLPAVGKDKLHVTQYNKIAVYQKEPHIACCATDGSRLHFAYSGGDLDSWYGSKPTHILDAKKVKKVIDHPLEFLLEHSSTEVLDTDQRVWGTSIWVAMQKGASEPDSGWTVNHKYMSDAFRSAIDVGPEKQVKFSCGSCLDPIWIYTSNYLAIVMPLRRSKAMTRDEIT